MTTLVDLPAAQAAVTAHAARPEDNVGLDETPWCERVSAEGCWSLECLVCHRVVVSDCG